MPVVQCKTCGRDFAIKPVHIRPDGNCCSVACRSTGVTKNCKICHALFYAPRTRLNPKFCSPACHGVAARQMHRCIVCGTEFYRGGAKYCSKKCFGVDHATGESRACMVCNAEVWVPQNKLVKQTEFFCSRAHASVWLGRNKTTHVCKMCQGEFQWSPSRTKSGAYHVTYCTLKCMRSDPAWSERMLRMRLAQQTMKESSLERVGYALLDEMGVIHQRQYVIGGKFTVDAFVPEVGVVIQWDGDYWHGHPVRFPHACNDARVRRRMALDISQDAYMAKCGYSVIRVWESEFKAGVDAVRERIRASLALPARTPSVPASDRPAV